MLLVDGTGRTRYKQVGKAAHGGHGGFEFVRDHRNKFGFGKVGGDNFLIEQGVGDGSSGVVGEANGRFQFHRAKLLHRLALNQHHPNRFLLMHQRHHHLGVGGWGSQQIAAQVGHIIQQQRLLLPQHLADDTVLQPFGRDG